LNPLDIRLGDYLASLEDRNWHTLALLIDMERNQLSEETAREMMSVYLTANAKRKALIDAREQRKTA
jgi:hypothetical protein